jgi:hypothetical protein
MAGPGEEFLLHDSNRREEFLTGLQDEEDTEGEDTSF